LKWERLLCPLNYKERGGNMGGSVLKLLSDTVARLWGIGRKRSWGSNEKGKLGSRGGLQSFSGRVGLTQGARALGSTEEEQAKEGSTTGKNIAGGMALTIALKLPLRSLIFGTC